MKRQRSKASALAEHPSDLVHHPERVLEWLTKVVPDEDLGGILGDVEEAFAGEAWALFNVGNWANGRRNQLVPIAVYAVAAANGEDDAWRNLGFCLDNLGVSEAALVVWEVAAHRGDTGAALHLAMEVEVQGDLARAEALCRLAMEEAATPVRLARVLRALGRDAEADAVIVEGRFRSPEAATDWAKMPGVSVEDGIALLERHLREGAEEVLIVLADLYEQAGRVDDAIAALCRSVSGGERNAPHNLALLLKESGRRGYLKWFLLAAREGDPLSIRWMRRHWGWTWRLVPGHLVRHAHRDPGTPVADLEYPLSPAETLILAIAARARTMPSRFTEVKVEEPKLTTPYREAIMTTPSGNVVWLWEEDGRVVANVEGHSPFRVSVTAPDDWRPERINGWVDGVETELVAINRNVVTRLRERRRRRHSG